MAGNDGESTHLSLLQALVNSENREESWRAFLRRYEPLIYRWCRRWRLEYASVEDVSAGVVAKLYTGLRTFQPENGGFRPWLRTVVDHAVLDHLRHLHRHPDHQGVGGSAAREQLDQIESPDALEDLARSLDQMIDDDMQQAMAVVRAKIAPKRWEAFVRRVSHDQPAREVAADLGMSSPAVHQAVFWIGNEIRKEYRKLLGSSETNLEGPS